jgi:UDP-glucose 4-epimerase
MGDSGEVIPKFMLRCLAGLPMVIFGDGMQTRDFTYVTDTAAGILLAGESDSAVGDTINIGSGREVTINDLGRLIAEVTSRSTAALQHDPPRPGDVLRLCADISHARTTLGFEPRLSLAEGLRELLEWYNAQGSTPAQLLEREVVRNWESDQHQMAEPGNAPVR